MAWTHSKFLWQRYVDMEHKNSVYVLLAPDVIGIVTTRTVAESVFCSQLLKCMRDSGFDVDAVAEHLHRTQAPTQPIPSKHDHPVEFINPVVVDVVSKLKVLQPQKVEGSAVRRLQQVEQELREAKRQLSAVGKGEKPAPASVSASVSNKRPPSELLGSSPKKRARPKQKAISAAPSGNLKSLWAHKHQDSFRAMNDPSDQIDLFSHDIPEKEKEKGYEVITAVECLRPRSPVLQDNAPTGHSDTTISKWVKSFPAETREAAVKL
jgi:DNA-binding transcriptional MerR regulator